MTMAAAKLHDSVALQLDPPWRDNYWRARQYGRVVATSDTDPNLVYVDWGTDGSELPGAQLTGQRERWHVDQLTETYPAPTGANRSSSG
ncbi:hypothetical protein [Mycobacterium sp. 1245111.1]|uniref:hypothetical protein n=1 Tax=Mycobacterium sp. 1245111.1 TaxID=1834073 RepID=UPI0012E9C107|nr:hypothetical protein [Mycobacterium sp. 1245111.1]